ncbi:DUF6503 family protein [Phaeodactylibacter luteus]|uniref:Uncharacterized protein n=1 Tax=Phaeodactylibacter luteus TaxID=1564516 RepID=A0A5C6S0F9_9BACT|nr:DUF6503 family protein [Phaeodactylibacter luteus]TXB67884.1 hypothetical protein FRY97_03295 [Phaeodactylibacter luteus]
MRPLGYFLLSALLWISSYGCDAPEGGQAAERVLPAPQEVLRKSLAFHDPAEQWPQARLKLTLAEPRIGFAERVSRVQLDQQRGRFELLREYDGLPVARILTKDSCYSLINGQPVTDTALINQYRLQCERTLGYQGFYELLTGLPMTLFTPDVALGPDTRALPFAGSPCYEISARLNNPVISEDWVFYFDQATFQLRGFGYAAAEGGEYLEIDGLAHIQQMQLPRMRHWYSRADSAYLGSDILIDVSSLPE